MFRATISSSPMVSEAANACFPNITGEGYSGDYSFIATLRALVAPRMKEGDTIRLKFTRSSFSTRDLSSNSAERVVKAALNLGYYNPGSIIVHSFEGRTQEDNFANMELMKSTFCKVWNGFERINKITDFFRKTFYSLCFVNPATKQAVIFVDSLNLRKLHYLQCAIFAFLPWYFDPKVVVVSEDEMGLIQSLREKTPDKYREYIDKIAKNYDFRAAHIKNLLTGFETRFDKMELERVERQINDVVRYMNELDRKMGNKLAEKRELDIKYLGLEEKISSDSGESEIMDYFLCNKKLFLERVDDSTIAFSCKDYLSYFDEDMAKRVIDNQRSYVYRPDGVDCSGIIGSEDMKKLMYAIFIDQTLKVKLCAAYTFRLGESVYPQSHHSFGPEFEDCIANTHIDTYQCLGNYSRAINNCLKTHDYIGALEQCIASCKSLNFGDGIVMRDFMLKFYGHGGYSRNKCIELPDGRTVNAIDAVKWMKEQEAAKKAEEERKAAEEAAKKEAEEAAKASEEQESGNTSEETQGAVSEELELEDDGEFVELVEE